jgi:hypothetical protein
MLNYVDSSQQLHQKIIDSQHFFFDNCKNNTNSHKIDDLLI